MISAALSSAGRTSGRVTRRKVCTRVAPLISADSSREGSVDRNAATMNRNAIGRQVQALDPDHPPDGEDVEGARPKTGSSALLIRPIYGLARKIQAIV